MLQVISGLAVPRTRRNASKQGVRSVAGCAIAAWSVGIGVKKTYDTVVDTFTLFSHSNSVHMLLNYRHGVRMRCYHDKSNGDAKLSTVHIPELPCNTRA